MRWRRTLTRWSGFALLLTAGCVERRFIIESDPPGAVVIHNGVYLGPAPADGYISYYGKQQFQLMKPGYETLDVAQSYLPAWYDWPGIDFFTENIWPFKLRDVRKFRYTMRPLATIRPDEVQQRAEELRARGRTLGVPRDPRPIPAAPPAPPPPPPQDLPQPRPALLDAPAPAGILPNVGGAESQPAGNGSTPAP